jgi:hypothetical protein
MDVNTITTNDGFEMRITNMQTGEVVHLEHCEDMYEVYAVIEDWRGEPNIDISYEEA